MKILHFILGKANPDRANGVNHVIHGLCKYTSLAGHDVRVIGVSKNLKEPYELVQRDNFQVQVYSSFFGRCFKELKKGAADADIVHLHSVWQHYNIIFANYLISIKKPYVVTIHSGLTEDRIKQSNYWVKMIYHRLFQKNIFDKAAGIQAITREELSDIAKHTSNNNIFFVSNGIDLNDYNLDHKYYNQNKSKIDIGYLGRFGTEKNIFGLIMAISRLPESYLNTLQCHLIGPIDTEGKRLKSLVEELNISHIIRFCGPLYNEDKYGKLKFLDFYIHPAYSDVVSIAVMEAMASGLPCIITRTSQVSYYYKSNAFVMVEPVIEDIKRGIMQMIDQRDNWKSMSINSLKLVQDIFNWENVSDKLINEYETIRLNYK